MGAATPRRSRDIATALLAVGDRPLSKDWDIAFHWSRSSLWTLRCSKASSSSGCKAAMRSSKRAASALHLRASRTAFCSSRLPSSAGSSPSCTRTSDHSARKTPNRPCKAASSEVRRTPARQRRSGPRPSNSRAGPRSPAFAAAFASSKAAAEVGSAAGPETGGGSCALPMPMVDMRSVTTPQASSVAAPPAGGRPSSRRSCLHMARSWTACRSTGPTSSSQMAETSSASTITPSSSIAPAS
mmetsp:Transcript_44414/g.129140  ORF Transcript_44414/g.129140 Transcript_44414/m.129140 type:complete len:242 (+) Transcript_44414:451-1176(+)